MLLLQALGVGHQGYDPRAVGVFFVHSNSRLTHGTLTLPGWICPQVTFLSFLLLLMMIISGTGLGPYRDSRAGPAHQSCSCFRVCF